MKWLKKSTAVTLKMGPFLDTIDGDTAETGLTIAQANVRLSKNGGDYAQKNEASASAHDEGGEYNVVLDTTDTNTLGILKVFIHVSGALAVWETCIVLPAVVYDALVLGTDALQVDAIQLAGVVQSLTDLKHFADSGYDPATGKVVGVKTADVSTVNTDMRGTNSAALAAVCTEARLVELAAANLPTDIDAIKAKTDNLPDGVKKNTALNNFKFVMIDSNGTPLTALTITAQRSIDDEAFANCANSVTEISDGAYRINLAAADLNGDLILLKFSASGAKITWVEIKTEE